MLTDREKILLIKILTDDLAQTNDIEEERDEDFNLGQMDGFYRRHNDYFPIRSQHSEII